MVTSRGSSGAPTARAAAGTRTRISYSVASQGGDHMSTRDRDRRGRRSFGDSTGMCSFQGLSRDQQIEWLQAITGFGITADDISKVLIPRWTTMMRISLLLAGWTYKDDVNPPRCLRRRCRTGRSRAGRSTRRSSTDDEAGLLRKPWAGTRQGVPTTATLQAHGFSAFDAALAPLRARA